MGARMIDLEGLAVFYKFIQSTCTSPAELYGERLPPILS